MGQIDNVRAEEEYRANPWGTKPLLSTDAYYDMVLAATGSEGTARKRAKVRRAAMIKEGIEAT